MLLTISEKIDNAFQQPSWQVRVAWFSSAVVNAIQFTTVSLKVEDTRSYLGQPTVKPVICSPQAKDAANGAEWAMYYTLAAYR